MKQWKCSVCGYIHKGENPPDNCPVCGAEREKFEVVIEQVSKPEISKPVISPSMPDDRKPKTKNIKKLIFDLISKHHLHPISVHIPNGLLPISVIFILLAVIFQFKSLQIAAFCNTVFLVLAMPIVLFTGYADWQNKYEGKLTPTFIAKMICGSIVWITAFILVVWQLFDPAITATTSNYRSEFVFINLIMLAAAGTAGFFGGKLVFKD